MNKRLLAAFALIFLLLPACAGQPPRPPVYAFGTNAILIHVRTADRLNAYEGGTSSLGMCVLQLNGAAGFQYMQGDPAGLEKLLNCSQTPAGTVGSKRLNIHAGQDYTFLLNRAEGTRYVGIAVGYAYMNKASMTRLFEVPLLETGGWLFNRVLEPVNMVIDLELGPDGFQSAVSRVKAD